MTQTNASAPTPTGSMDTCACPSRSFQWDPRRDMVFVNVYDHETQRTIGYAMDGLNGTPARWSLYTGAEGTAPDIDEAIKDASSALVAAGYVKHVTVPPPFPGRYAEFADNPGQLCAAMRYDLTPARSPSTLGLVALMLDRELGPMPPPPEPLPLQVFHVPPQGPSPRYQGLDPNQLAGFLRLDVGLLPPDRQIALTWAVEQALREALAEPLPADPPLVVYGRMGDGFVRAVGRTPEEADARAVVATGVFLAEVLAERGVVEMCDGEMTADPERIEVQAKEWIAEMLTWPMVRMEGPREGLDRLIASLPSPHACRESVGELFPVDLVGVAS